MARKPVNKKGKGPKGKSLTSDDKSLWDHVSKNVVPQESNRFTGFEDLLKGQGFIQQKPDAPMSGFPNPVGRPKKQPLPPLTGVGHRAKKDENQVFKDAVSPSIRQNVPGLDRNTSERLRKGRLEIEGRIDLHGHNRREAHSRLRSFIGSAHRQDKRCVLVITGKGRSAKPTDDAPFMGSGGRGILREEVPKWLAEPDLRRLVLDYRTAQAKHGGEGALYVLLRRTRR